MSNYTKTTNFASKDSLPSGNANKIVKGTEIDTEFNNIATAVATKADTADPAFTGVVSFPDGSASAPSITNTGDTNTGLFFSAADTLAFSAAGTAQFTMADGVIAPVTDNDVDLGTSSLEFKDGYFDGTLYTDAINLDGTAITSTAAEINILDGVTATTAELNILDGVTSTAAELNILDGVTSTAAELNILDGVTSTTAELNILDGVTATTAELNIMDGVTATTAELNIMDGVTSTTAELNILDGKAFLDEDDMSSNSATGIASQQSIKAYVDAQITAEDLDVTSDSGTIAIDLDSETLTIAGGEGIDTSATGNTVTIAGENASTTNKGVASFDSNDFTVSSGAVSLATTSTAAELNILDGATLSTAELNILDGVTSTTAELNILDGVTSTAAELNILDGVTSTAAELNILDGKAFLDEDDMSSNSATGIASQQSIKAYVDAQITAEDLDFQADSGGALSIDLDSETLTFTGGTGIDTSGSGNAVTFAIDSTVATLTGSQTLTNKSLTAPTLTGTAVVASLDISGDIDVDGTTNLDVVDIDGAVDMASTLQVDGAITSSTGATITTADNTDTLSLISTDADANTGPNLRLYRNSSSAADDDVTGVITFLGKNDAGTPEDVIYARQLSYIKDASDGTEDGQFKIQTMLAGTIRDMFNITPSEFVFNEDSQNVDFRVESDGNANMLFVDGGNDRVGIGLTPRATLDVFQQTNRTSKTGQDRGVLHLQDGDTAANNEITAITFESNSSNASSIIGQSLTNSGSQLFFGTSNSYVSGVTNTALTIDQGGVSTFDVGAIFNESSADSDFRVESNGNSHMLFVDSGNDAVGIGVSDVADAQLVIRSTGVDGTYNNVLSAQYSGNSNEHNVIGTTVSSTAANSGFIFKASDGGGSTGTTEVLKLTRAGAIFNDASGDQDFRVESDSNANGLLYDAGTQKLSMNGTYLGSDVGFCINGISTDSIACLELNGDRSTSSTVNAIRMYCAGTEVGTIDTLRDGADNNAAMRFFTGNSGTLTEGFKLTAAGQPIFAVARNDTTSDAANMNIRSSDGLVRRSTSSRRYKNTITDATHGLTELLKLRSVTYKGNNDGDRLFGGLIAEEVHDAGLTEFVQYNSDDEPDALAYGHMVSLCIKAIQEQQALIETLQAEVAALKGG